MRVVICRGGPNTRLLYLASGVDNLQQSIASYGVHVWQPDPTETDPYIGPWKFCDKRMLWGECFPAALLAVEGGLIDYAEVEAFQVTWIGLAWRVMVNDLWNGRWWERVVVGLNIYNFCFTIPRLLCWAIHHLVFENPRGIP